MKRDNQFGVSGGTQANDGVDKEIQFLTHIDYTQIEEMDPSFCNTMFLTVLS